ncbi:heterokaryon incompatibility protein-domain-containing protein [Leptodontidium sp. MPI-SDFR-AT-0119]|nr:heterokaryon incompatibility protein-domain-containing protein [Leptodontidium sp. MPI-SDFR-AT-0119]
MSLHLCDVCQKLDIRKLLAQSEAQTSTTIKTRLTGLHDDFLEYKSGLPDFFQHQKSLSALETSANTGCTFCRLIFESWSGDSGRYPTADKAIDDAGQGQLFIGTSGHCVSKAEMPTIIVTQRPDHSSRTLCTFDVFSNRDSVPRKTSKFVGTPVASHSDSELCRVAAMEWFQDCLLTHPECGPSRSFRRPTRLINVGRKGSNDPPRLSVEEVPQAASWAALSYCWGPGITKFTLRSDTVEEFRAGIALEKWPATLRDAIQATQKLDLQYIWIDALCILQDSTTDWRAESARMQDVYSGAAVTIIASESPSTAAGIYASRPPIKWEPCQLPFLDGKEQCTVWLRPSFRNAVDLSYTNPLQTRIWTLQEGLLASRSLSFRKDQTVWECSRGRFTESGHVLMKDHLFDSKDFFHNKTRKNKANAVYQGLQFGILKQISAFETQKARIGWLPKYMTSSGLCYSLNLNPYTRWFEIIFEYSRRNYTKDTDILPALGGVARAFADITKDKYCAGMWESELLQCLCWSRQVVWLNKSSRRLSLSDMDFTKPTAYRAPSWSWASINGGRVTMYNSAIGDDIPITNVATPVKIHLEPLAEDLYGQLKSGYLSIKGSLFMLGDLWAEYWRNTSSSWEEYKSLPKSNTAESKTCKYPALHVFALQLLNKGGGGTFEFEQQHISSPNQRFAAFLIASTEGIPEEYKDNENESMTGAANLLLLESTGAKDNEYRRIGVFILKRPWEISVIVSETHRIETKKWKDLMDEDWKRFEEKVERPSVGVLEGKAWIEVAKQCPKRMTIRIV